MKHLVAIPTLLLMLLSVGAWASDKGFTFVQIADTQLGFSNGDGDIGPDMDHFRLGVDYINRLKPAFVVISGDLINKAHDPKEIRAFWQVARGIRPDVPLYLLPGNHDIGVVTEANVKSYSKLFGRDHYVFSYGNSRFIVLDSNLIKDTKAAPSLSDEQLKWFESELESARKGKAEHIFVLTHHSWCLKTPDENDEYFNIPKTIRQGYLELMKRYGVDFALAGHYHEEATVHDGGFSMITTSAISKGLGKEPAGLKVFHVYPDRVENTYYSLDQIREQIKERK